MRSSLQPVDIKQSTRLPVFINLPRKGYDNLGGIWYRSGFYGPILMNCTFFIVWTRRAGTWDRASL